MVEDIPGVEQRSGNATTRHAAGDIFSRSVCAQLVRRLLIYSFLNRQGDPTQTSCRFAVSPHTSGDPRTRSALHGVEKDGANGTTVSGRAG